MSGLEGQAEHWLRPCWDVAATQAEAMVLAGRAARGASQRRSRGAGPQAQLERFSVRRSARGSASRFPWRATSRFSSLPAA